MPPAKYNGTCVRCGKPYLAGDEVTWSRRGEPGQYHLACKVIRPGALAMPPVAVTLTPMPIIAPSATAEPTEPTTEVLTETEPETETIECQCPHSPECPAYVPLEWDEETEAHTATEPIAESAPDHTGDPLPEFECCPGEMWLRIKTYDEGIREFNKLISKLTAKKDLTGLYGAARTLGESIRFRMYPDPALRFADYLVGFLACLATMTQVGVIPLETIPEAEPTWDSLLAEWGAK